MPTRHADDWRVIGDVLLIPEVLGAIIGGTGTPLITYLVRRKKEMPAWQRVAELISAGVLGAGAGAGIGYGGSEVARLIRDLKEALKKLPTHNTPVYAPEEPIPPYSPPVVPVPPDAEWLVGRTAHKEIA